MYLGRIVEEGPVPAIFEEPLHPYTQMLRAASPVPDPAARVRAAAQDGEIPSAIDPPPGCAFHPRCPHAMPRCKDERTACFARSRRDAPPRATSSTAPAHDARALSSRSIVHAVARAADDGATRESAMRCILDLVGSAAMGFDSAGAVAAERPRACWSTVPGDFADLVLAAQRASAAAARFRQRDGPRPHSTWTTACASRADIRARRSSLRRGPRWEPERRRRRARSCTRVVAGYDAAVRWRSGGSRSPPRAPGRRIGVIALGRDDARRRRPR